MKAKLLMLLLAALFILPVSEAAITKKRKIPRYKESACGERITPRTPIDYTNEASGKNIHGKQKTTYSVTLKQNTMLNIHIGFQKKLWYGWRRDNHRDAYYYFDASPFQYNYWLKPNAKDAPLLQQDITCPDIYFFENEGTIDYESGYIVGGSKVLTGKLYVWTDYTVETSTKRYKQVVKKYKMFPNEEMPICDKNKAYTLDFTLNYLW
ncbi:hypothetical protein [uncultured Bacteroides sp.]|uniref:hypothetical protein n=1 Tax=uncultured Bacteroides sp. TaxID=162156 RepID=UPI0025949AD6|nr:hypothetical protein [uncultured Bacteroides sp.]